MPIKLSETPCGARAQGCKLAAGRANHTIFDSFYWVLDQS